MLQQWEMQSHMSPLAPLNIQDDLKTLAFHILNRAGYGVRLQWPGISGSDNIGTLEDVDDGMIMDGSTLEGDHGMRFGEAMLIVVDHLKELFLFPKWFLSAYCPNNFLG
jgi:hypothetical protein